MPPPTRITSSWVGTWLEYTELKPSPEIFRLWAGFSAVASALQRRVWMRVNTMTVYPNLYVALIGPPGVGKTVAITCAKEIAGDRRFSKFICLAPDSITRESFFEEMAAASVKVKRKNGSDIVESLDESPFTVMSNEFGTLLGTRNMEFIRALSDLFDCSRPSFKHSTKHSGDSTILGPWLNIIAGTTPHDLAEVLPKEAPNQGFTSRFIFVYSNEEYETDDLFASVKSEDMLYEALMEDYSKILEMEGAFQFEEKAKNLLNDWNKSKKKTEPKDPSLGAYNARRLVHLCKLTMVVAASRHQDLIIYEEDVKDSIDYLHEVEKPMVKALASTGGSDQASIPSLILSWMKQVHEETRKPIRGRMVRQKVSTYVRAHDIPHIMNIIKEYCSVEGEYPSEFYTPIDPERGVM